MFNIALLNKTENIGLASNALHLMLIFQQPPFSYIKNDPSFYFYIFADHIKVHLPC